MKKRREKQKMNSVHLINQCRCSSLPANQIQPSLIFWPPGAIFYSGWGSCSGPIWQATVALFLPACLDLVAAYQTQERKKGVAAKIKIFDFYSKSFPPPWRIFYFCWTLRSHLLNINGRTHTILTCNAIMYEMMKGVGAVFNRDFALTSFDGTGIQTCFLVLFCSHTFDPGLVFLLVLRSWAPSRRQ